MVTKPPFVTPSGARAVRSRIAQVGLIVAGLLIALYPFTLGASPAITCRGVPMSPGPDLCQGRRIGDGDVREAGRRLRTPPSRSSWWSASASRDSASPCWSALAADPSPSPRSAEPSSRHALGLARPPRRSRTSIGWPPLARLSEKLGPNDRLKRFESVVCAHFWVGRGRHRQGQAPARGRHRQGPAVCGHSSCGHPSSKRVSPRSARAASIRSRSRSPRSGRSSSRHHPTAVDSSSPTPASPPR